MDRPEDLVGYKRPPRATRFQKGRSGNPKGRPSRKADATPYERVLGRMVTVRIGETEVRLTAAEAFLLQQSRLGMAGNVSAIKDTLEAIQDAHLRRRPKYSGPIEVRIALVSPGNPNSAMLTLGMARKFNRYEKTAYIMLEPWLVEAALQRLGSRQLSNEEQRIVFEVTRNPHQVKWPSWWVVRS